jgi:hypothetical protein
MSISRPGTSDPGPPSRNAGAPGGATAKPPHTGGGRLASSRWRPFRVAHLLWAILILLGCVALVTGGGHPPPIVLVPPLLLAGALGHLLLVLIQWLLRKGRTRIAADPAPATRWPPELILIALVLGSFALMATALTVGEVALIRMHPLQWLTYAGVAVLHSVAFVLLLLRFGQVRFLIAAVCLGWALALVHQLRDARTGEWPLGLSLIGALLAIAIYVVRSQRVRSVLR